MSYCPNKYQRQLQTHICRICQTVFIGTNKRKTCSKECTAKSKLAGMCIKYHRTFCKDCKLLLYERKKYGKKAKEVLKYKRCSPCAKIYRSTYHRGRYIPVDPKISLLKKQRQSENMRKNNPMFKKEVAAKVGATLLKRYQNGEIVYKKGTNHPRWKGNRSRDQIIRTRLLEWRKFILKRDGFKCTQCDSNIKLEIHHTERFRLIVDKFTKKPISNYDVNSIEFENLIQIIVNYHWANLHIGQTLCRQCHGKYDPLRHLKNEDKNNTENQTTNQSI